LACVIDDGEAVFLGQGEDAEHPPHAGGAFALVDVAADGADMN